jgi:hypothetical protein
MVVLPLLICLVVIPALAGLWFEESRHPHPRRSAVLGHFHVGDPIIYRKHKFSTRPGPRAHDVSPAPFGDTYSYLVDKYWTVEDLQDDRIVATTRTHKVHYLSPTDPNLRKAGWFERLRHWSRFPRLDENDVMP